MHVAREVGHVGCHQNGHADRGLAISHRGVGIHLVLNSCERNVVEDVPGSVDLRWGRDQQRADRVGSRPHCTPGSVSHEYRAGEHDECGGGEQRACGGDVGEQRLSGHADRQLGQDGCPDHDSVRVGRDDMSGRWLADTQTGCAVSGSSPIDTNSVVPMPNPPRASANTARRRTVGSGAGITTAARDRLAIDSSVIIGVRLWRVGFASGGTRTPRL